LRAINLESAIKKNRQAGYNEFKNGKADLQKAFKKQPIKKIALYYCLKLFNFKKALVNEQLGKKLQRNDLVNNRNFGG
jgi:hypothetical protein